MLSQKSNTQRQTLFIGQDIPTRIMSIIYILITIRIQYSMTHAGDDPHWKLREKGHARTQKHIIFLDPITYVEAHLHEQVDSKSDSRVKTNKKMASISMLDVVIVN